MSIKGIISKGIGFSPGSLGAFISKGYLGVAAPAGEAWIAQGDADGTWLGKALVDGDWTGQGTMNDPWVKKQEN
jgi:hypothetical protein